MTREKLCWEDSKTVRDTLNKAYELSRECFLIERQLIDLLQTIDHRKLYIRYGYKSLRGFCWKGLNFTPTQSQRLVTQVRRALPMCNIGASVSEFDSPLGAN